MSPRYPQPRRISLSVMRNQVQDRKLSVRLNGSGIVPFAHSRLNKILAGLRCVVQTTSQQLLSPAKLQNLFEQTDVAATLSLNDEQVQFIFGFIPITPTVCYSSNG